MIMQLLGIAILISSSAGVARAADVVPRSDSPSESRPGEPTPPNTMPTPPPSTIDPGIQKLPETIPDPKAAVPPPVVDPNMVIDPETRRRESEEVPQKDKPAAPPGVPRR